ncbi:uncharacterized protein LOC113296972 [Papaver somniferum]|uniref:uncharacterized protein LOC113296972 n=1 Tax=Papaver somniferum TaxID=3469 RepID=UPI000E6FEF31|nr:uncharacterized protein LOC113296972 [Papaver somniferum]XP_026401128.1 uncharacterized protein LOC113296972 [Papaver somniferum]XP_026401129.1 uncharacterized protein LOC113296972 [Papaver somniferum]XP_026401130.1 uncharacterized protein LOC113296972 [Papaver somniferum]
MRTNDVSSLDLLLLDDADDLMHAIVQKKYIWKFEPLLEKGMLLGLTNLTFATEKKMFRPAQNDYRPYFNWNTDVTPLEFTTTAIPRHKFFFTGFEAVAVANNNTYLNDKKVSAIFLNLTCNRNVDTAAAGQVGSLNENMVTLRKERILH